MIPSRCASFSASHRLSSMQHSSRYCMSSSRAPLCAHDYLEPAEDHPLGVERHALDVAHHVHPLVLHHLCVDAVAMLARLVHDVGEDHRFAVLLLDAARERCPLAPAHVVGHGLDVVRRAVLEPDFAGDARDAAIGLKFSFRDRNDETIYVAHYCLLKVEINFSAASRPPLI